MKIKTAITLLLFAIVISVKAQGGQEQWIKNGNRNIYGVLNIPDLCILWHQLGLHSGSSQEITKKC